MAKPRTVSQELWDQWMTLADPATKWVRGCPSEDRESCLVMRIKDGTDNAYDSRYYDSRYRFLAFEAEKVLELLIEAETESPYVRADAVRFNDYQAKNRQHVLAVIEEAYYLAKEMGL